MDAVICFSNPYIFNISTNNSPHAFVFSTCPQGCPRVTGFCRGFHTASHETVFKSGLIGPAQGFPPVCSFNQGKAQVDNHTFLGIFYLFIYFIYVCNLPAHLWALIIFWTVGLRKTTNIFVNVKENVYKKSFHCARATCVFRSTKTGDDLISMSLMNMSVNVCVCIAAHLCVWANSQFTFPSSANCFPSSQQQMSFSTNSSTNSV